MKKGERKEGEEEGKQAAGARRQADRPQKPAAPPIFSETVEGSTEITKMRQVVAKVWNMIG